MEIKIDEQMKNVIMKLAKAIILKEEELKALRKSEDYIDLDEVRGPQKCEDCND